jgi:predicted NAD/FAD-binding protein
MARVIALTALAALGFSGATFHETFHADGRYSPIALTKRSDRSLTAARRNLTSLVRRGFIV